MSSTAHLDSLRAGQDWIATPDALLSSDGPHRGWSAGIVGGTFAAVGPTERVRDLHPMLDEIALPGQLMMPGFVDTHQHLTQVFAKVLIGAQPAQIWKRMWLPLYGAMDPHDAYLAAKWTALESLRGGFTTIVTAGERDPLKVEPIEQAIGETGIRCVMAHDFSDLGGGPPSAEPADREAVRDCLRRAGDYLSRPSQNSRLIRAVTCASHQSASLELIAALSRLSAEASVVFQIHSNEHTPEVEWCLDTYGRRPIELLHDIGALGPQALLAHATLVSSTEVGLLQDSGTCVSYNPVASAWKGNAVAPALEFANRGIPFGLGTDATRNDGFRLMDAAETAQRLIFGMRTIDWSSGDGRLWLHAATGNGAAAACLGGATGSIAEGLRADFLVVGCEEPEVLPSWDLEWELVRHYDRTNLRAVFVDGEATVIDGQPVGWDLGRFMDEAAEAGRRAARNADMRLIGQDPRGAGAT